MPKADQAPITDRRAFIALPFAAIPFTRPRTIGADADRVLIDLCREFDHLERIVQRACDGPGAIAGEAAAEAFTGPIIERQRRLLEHLYSLQAKTLPGLRARAASFQLWSGELAAGPHGGWRGLMLAPLLRDLAAVG